MDDHYIYVFVRLDLPLDEQIVHSGHAIERLATLQRYSDSGIPNLIAIGLRSEFKLNEALVLAKENQLPHYPWRDPDINDELRALAVGPLSREQKEILRKYRLYSPGASKGSCRVKPDGGASAVVAQEREHRTFSPGVGGSSPSNGSTLCQVG